jgi:galactose-1-phosphate uridylyltransferase
MARQMDRQLLKKLLQSDALDQLTFEDLEAYFRADLSLKPHPQNWASVDPRDGTRVVFNLARARRPHDYPASGTSAVQSDAGEGCPICAGQTTGIIDYAELSDGFTFINKNLFPIFYPAPAAAPEAERKILPEGLSEHDPTHGFHFLQWTSSIHGHDWHNMPLADRVIVLERLAALEQKLFSITGGYVSIIKNHGREVGGSLTHPHQQIVVSGTQPNRHRQNQLFLEEHGETFADYMLRENPAELRIRDYGAALLLTPYYMRRPFDMLLLLKDTQKSHLHHLDREQLSAVADGWADAIRIILTVLPGMGRAPAYNIAVHNGPGAGLYFEFLPYSQELGGFEQLGLYICQSHPREAAQAARTSLGIEE